MSSVKYTFKNHVKLVMIEVAVSDPIEITRIMNVAGYKVYKELRGINIIN